MNAYDARDHMGVYGYAMRSRITHTSYRHFRRYVTDQRRRRRRRRCSLAFTVFMCCLAKIVWHFLLVLSLVELWDASLYTIMAQW